jgi:hypothetical protein
MSETMPRATAGHRLALRALPTQHGLQSTALTEAVLSPGSLKASKALALVIEEQE